MENFKRIFHNMFADLLHFDAVPNRRKYELFFIYAVINSLANTVWQATGFLNARLERQMMRGSSQAYRILKEYGALLDSAETISSLITLLTGIFLLYLFYKSKIWKWIFNKFLGIVAGMAASLLVVGVLKKCGLDLLIIPCLFISIYVFKKRRDFVKTNISYIGYPFLGTLLIYLALMAGFFVGMKVTILGIFTYLLLATCAICVSVIPFYKGYQNNTPFYRVYGMSFIVPITAILLFISFCSLSSGIHNPFSTHNNCEIDAELVSDVDYSSYDTDYTYNGSYDSTVESMGDGEYAFNLENNVNIDSAEFTTIPAGNDFAYQNFNMADTPFADIPHVVEHPYELFSVFQHQDVIFSNMAQTSNASDIISTFSDANGVELFSIDGHGTVFNNLHNPIGSIVQDPAFANTSHFVDAQNNEIFTARTTGNDTQFFNHNSYLGHISANAKGVETFRGPHEGILAYKDVNGYIFDNGKPIGRCS